MGCFNKREGIILLVVVFFIIFVIVLRVGLTDIKVAKDESLNLISSQIEEEDYYKTDKEDDIETIMVHITGQVYKPGIVEIDLGKRIIDAIDIAGGLMKEADLDRINLAKKLIDEEKIYIPKIGEELSNDIIDLSVSSVSIDSKSIDKININKCNQMELESLPGIGQVLAGRIIDYRNSNVFVTIDDLKQVSGIGEKKYDAVKDLIRVK